MRHAGLLLAFAICLCSFVSRAQPFYTGAGWTGHGDTSVTAFGWSMSAVGDVNGDGYEDLLVSAIDYGNPFATEEEEGKLYLYYGGPDGLTSSPVWTYETNITVSILGFSTDGGDINGDGYSDIAAGSIQWTDPEQDEGRIWIWYGGPDGLNPDAPDWTLEMDQPYALLGSSVAMGGDINNDGYNDLFFSAKMWDEPESNEGKIWLYYGSPDGPVDGGWTWQSDQTEAIAGFPVAYAGDVNGDGIDDVIIGANKYDFVDVDDGLAVAFYGSADGPAETPDWIMSSGQKKCSFGHWVDDAGDVNGDGYDDVIISALLYEDDSSQHNEGRAFVFYGSADGLADTAAWFADVNQAEAQLGYCVAGAGDVNADGYSDVLVGAKYWTNGEEAEGGAWLWFGGPNGLDTTYCWHGEGDQANGYYGKHTGGNGDFNNDGYADFFVGAYRYTDSLFMDGKGFVYYGAPRQSDFHFEQTDYCVYDADPTPIIDGLSGGAFYSADTVIDAETGMVDLAASGAGTFTIRYTYADACPVERTIHIHNLNGLAEFYYAEDTVCLSADSPDAVFTGMDDGVFHSTAMVDSVTGTIDIAATGTGTYTIYYTVSAYGCTETDSTLLTIIPDANAIFGYPDYYFFASDPDPTPFIDADTGVFSATPPGLVFADAYGTIDLDATGPGTFSIQHINSNGYCADTAYFFITIDPACEQPQNVLIDSVTETSITISWDFDINYPYYTVYISDGTDTIEYFTTASPFTFEGLTPGVAYTMYVQINCAGFESIQSEDVTASTLPVAIYSYDASPPLQTFPNPVDAILSLQLPGKEICSIQLYNAAGACLFHMQGEGLVRIDMRSFPAGVYLIRCIANGRENGHAVVLKNG
ncbi:MAG: FG-GAP-like repeat-containing protein [Chitinophagales bacterium]